MDERAQAREMCSRPVDRPAVFTMEEAVVRQARVLGKAVLDEPALDASNRAVALEAAREGSDVLAEVERLDDLEKLRVRMHRANRVPVCHRATLEERSIPREHDPSLVARA